MAISVLQTAATVNSSGGSISVTVTISAGSIIHVWAYGADASTISFADNVNGSYGSNIDSFADIFEGGTDQIWAQARFEGAAAGSTTITATYGVSTITSSIFMAEIGGAKPGGAALDGHTGEFQGAVSGTTTDSVTSGTTTNAVQPALVLGFQGNLGGNTSNGGSSLVITQGTGFGTPVAFNDVYGCLLETKRITSTGTQAGTWTASGTGSTSMFWDAFVAVYDELAGPAINTQPIQTTVYQGQTATFTVSATSSGGSLSYQWTQNGSNVGTNSNSYTTAVTANSNNLDIYQVSVTDSNGTVHSNTVYLIVIPTASLAWVI